MLNIGGYGAYNYYDAYKASASASSFNTLGTATTGITNAGTDNSIIKNPGGSKEVLPGKRVSQAECETCNNRKYQDGSNESNVSFKAAAHISPESAGSAVRAHENEHVANAYKKAATDNGKVLRASVRIHTAICPECGHSYVSGGTTHTQIKYSNEDNPYQKDKKLADYASVSGMNIDIQG